MLTVYCLEGNTASTSTASTAAASIVSTAAYSTASTAADSVCKIKDKDYYGADLGNTSALSTLSQCIDYCLSWSRSRSCVAIVWRQRTTTCWPKYSLPALTDYNGIFSIYSVNMSCIRAQSPEKSSESTFRLGSASTSYIDLNNTYQTVDPDTLYLLKTYPVTLQIQTSEPFLAVTQPRYNITIYSCDRKCPTGTKYEEGQCKVDGTSAEDQCPAGYKVQGRACVKCDPGEECATYEYVNGGTIQWDTNTKNGWSLYYNGTQQDLALASETLPSATASGYDTMFNLSSTRVGIAINNKTVYNLTFSTMMRSDKYYSVKLSRSDTGTTKIKLIGYMCGAGTFRNKTSNACQTCDIGSYSTGGVECVKCSGLLSTLTNHSTKLTDCIEVCIVPSVGLSTNSRPAKGSRVNGSHEVQIQCQDGFTISQWVPCKDLANISCTAMDIIGPSYVTYNSTVTLTCRIISARNPTNVTWYTKDYSISDETDMRNMQSTRNTRSFQDRSQSVKSTQSTDQNPTSSPSPSRVVVPVSSVLQITKRYKYLTTSELIIERYNDTYHDMTCAAVSGIEDREISKILTVLSSPTIANISYVLQGEDIVARCTYYIPTDYTLNTTWYYQHRQFTKNLNISQSNNTYTWTLKDQTKKYGVKVIGCGGGVYRDKESNKTDVINITTSKYKLDGGLRIGDRIVVNGYYGNNTKGYSGYMNIMGQEDILLRFEMRPNNIILRSKFNGTWKTRSTNSPKKNSNFTFDILVKTKVCLITVQDKSFVLKHTRYLEQAIYLKFNSTSLAQWRKYQIFESGGKHTLPVKSTAVDVHGINIIHPTARTLNTNIGYKLTLICQASGGGNDQSITWKFNNMAINDSVIKSSVNITDTTQVTTSVLTDDITTKDAGNFTCYSKFEENVIKTASVSITVARNGCNDMTNGYYLIKFRYPIGNGWCFDQISSLVYSRKCNDSSETQAWYMKEVGPYRGLVINRASGQCLNLTYPVKKGEIISMAGVCNSTELSQLWVYDQPGNSCGFFLRPVGCDHCTTDIGGVSRYSANQKLIIFTSTGNTLADDQMIILERVVQECIAVEKEIITTQDSSLNVTFTLPEGSEILNITGPSGTNIDPTKLGTLSYSYFKSSVESSDAGTYTMFIKMDELMSNCVASVYFYGITLSEFKLLSATLQESWTPQAPENIAMTYRTYGSASDKIGLEAKYDNKSNVLTNKWLAPKSLSVTLKKGSSLVTSTKSASVSTQCLNRRDCDGVMDCYDGSDERNCMSTSDSLSKLVIKGQTTLYATNTDQTLCFYTYSNFRLSQDQSQSITQSNENQLNFQIGETNNVDSAYCVTYTASTPYVQIYSVTATSRDEVPSMNIKMPNNNYPIKWMFVNGEMGSLSIARVILFNKILDTNEMLKYVADCEEESYPDNSETLYDQHLFVMLNKYYWDSSMEVVGLLQSQCSSKVQTLDSTYNPLSDYVCNNGAVLQQHCVESGSLYTCGGDKYGTECDYYNSQSLTLSVDDGCSGSNMKHAQINNAYNNKLGLVALGSAKLFKGCTEGCSKARFDDMKIVSEILKWDDGADVRWKNFTENPTFTDVQSGVLSDDGAWSVTSTRTNMKSLCHNGDDGTSSYQVIKFSKTSGASQLNIQQDVGLDKMSLCFSASGMGTLLHYIGASSLTKKDLLIHFSMRNDFVFLTIYINGFPEYFDILRYYSSTNYICIRWEKLTGRIDAVINGQLLVGRNVYANSRRSLIPRRGIMTIGAGLKLDSSGLDGTFSGNLSNLVIWSDFFSPGVLSSSSKELFCSVKKTNAWLSFDTIKAGLQNSNAMELNGGCAMKRKRDIPLNNRTVREAVESVINVDYTKYVSDSTTLSSWLIAPEGVIVSGDVNDVVVRRAGSTVQFKIHPQKQICFSNTGSKTFSSISIKFGDTESAPYYQIGEKTFTTSSYTYNDVPGTDPTCLRNVMSESDYAQFSGFIEQITYDLDTTQDKMCEPITVTDPTLGSFEWSSTNAGDTVTLICNYGSTTSYDTPGLATRTCGDSGSWETGILSNCAERLTIDADAIVDYFNETEITDENTIEYTDNINTVITQTDTIDDTQLDTATDALTKLAETSSDIEISDEVMINVVEIADTINRNTNESTLKKQQTKKQASTMVVRAVATLAGRIEIEEGKSFSKKTPSVSLTAYRPIISNSGSGSGSSSGDTVPESVYASFTDTNEGTRIGVSESEPTENRTRVKLPRTAISSGQNIWFTSYNDSKLFAPDNAFSVEGKVVGAGIGEGGTDFDGKGLFELIFELGVYNQHALCQYWDMNKTSPVWTSSGMRFISKTDTHIICSSSHLTNFAILINPSDTQFTEVQTVVLRILTILGLVLSILGLLMTVVGLAVFRKIRSAITNKVHIGLSISLLVSYVVLLVGLDRTESKGACYFFAILLHFCFLSAFCWMLCEAANLYLRLVMVFSEYSKLFLKFTLFSTIIPAVVVIVTVIVEFGGGKQAYLPTEQASGQLTSCWLEYEARMIAFMVPLLLMLCFNFVVFILVMRVLFTNRKSDRSSFLPRLRSAICVSTLIGLTWIVGVLALGEASFVVNVIFTLLNSTQGALIFYLYCFAKSDVVSTWKSSFQKSFTSSTSAGDKGAISSSSMVHPSNTKSASMPMTSTTDGNDNVYTNGDSREPEYASVEDVDEDEEADHIYETAENPSDGVKLRSPENVKRPQTPQVDLKDVEVSDNLKGVVKEKVIEFETLTRNSVLFSNSTTCPVLPDPDACPQTFKTDSIVSESGSHSAFRL